MDTRISWPVVAGIACMGCIAIGTIATIPLRPWESTARRLAESSSREEIPTASRDASSGDAPSPSDAPFQFPPVAIVTGGQPKVPRQSNDSQYSRDTSTPNAAMQTETLAVPASLSEATSDFRLDTSNAPATTAQADPTAEALLKLADSFLDQQSQKSQTSELLADNPLANAFPPLTDDLESLATVPLSDLDWPLKNDDLSQPLLEEAVANGDDLSLTDSLQDSVALNLNLGLQHPSEGPDLTPALPLPADLPGSDPDATIAIEPESRSATDWPREDFISPGARSIKAQTVSSANPSAAQSPQSLRTDGVSTIQPSQTEPSKTQPSKTQPEPSLTQIPQRPLQPGQIALPVSLLQQMDHIANVYPDLSDWCARYRVSIQQLANAYPDQRRIYLEQLEHLRLELDSLFRPSQLSLQTGRSSQLKQLCYALDRRLDFWQAIVPGNPILVQRQQQTAGQIQLARSRRWNFDNVSITQPWADYLMWPQLVQVINDSQQSPAEKQIYAREILTRINSGTLTFQQETVIRQLLPLDLQKQLYRHAAIQIEKSDVLAAIESYETDLSHDASNRIMEGYRWLRLSEDVADQEIVNLIENHYRNANFRLTASREFINRWFVSQDWVNQTIARQQNNPVGIEVMPFQLQLIPSENGFHFQLAPTGQESGTSDGWQPVAPSEASKTDANDIISISFQSDDEAPPLPPGLISDSLITGGNYQRLPFADWVIARYPQGITPSAGEVAIRNESPSESTLARQLHHQLTERLRQTQGTMERFLQGFHLSGLSPKVVENRSTVDALITRFRVADSTQLASHTARPNPTANAILSLQIHQSFANNALPRIEVAGRTFTTNSLQQHLAMVMGLPAPNMRHAGTDQWTFADQQAIECEFQQGQILIHLRLAQARIQDWETGPIQITAAFAPVIDGCQVAIQRTAPIQIRSAHLTDQRRSQLQNYLGQWLDQDLIRITPQSWDNDFLARQLQITQWELSDGWLSVSVEPKPEQHQIALTNAHEKSSHPSATAPQLLPVPTQPEPTLRPVPVIPASQFRQQPTAPTLPAAPAASPLPQAVPPTRPILHSVLE